MIEIHSINSIHAELDQSTIVSEMESDYSKLPILVLDCISDYLSYKERVKCKAVCRGWRRAIEPRDKARQTLVLHVGPYLLNQKWSYSNQRRRLMGYANSFEIQSLNFLAHPLTRSSFKHIKKLCIFEYNDYLLLNTTVHNIRQGIDFLKQCEEIEILNLILPDKLVVFELPKLKVLVIKSGSTDYLITSSGLSEISLMLRSPSLQVLVFACPVSKIDCRYPKSLKHIECIEWPSEFKTNGTELTALEYLNLLNGERSAAKDDLLKTMPNLKKLIFHSDEQAVSKSFEEQKQRFRLNRLEILNFGLFGRAHAHEWEKGISLTCGGTKPLFDNYPRIESVPWKISLKYDELFNQFKILPSNFFERFRITYVQIGEVTSMTHLFAFLRHCPFLEKMMLNFDMLKEYSLVLEQMQLLSPSLRTLHIFTETQNANQFLSFDLAFLSVLKLVCIDVSAHFIPADFLRKLMNRRGDHFKVFRFLQLCASDLYAFTFGIHLVMNDRPNASKHALNLVYEGEFFNHPNIDSLIKFMQSSHQFSEVKHLIA